MTSRLIANKKRAILQEQFDDTDFLFKSLHSKAINIPNFRMNLGDASPPYKRVLSPVLPAEQSKNPEPLVSAVQPLLASTAPTQH